MRKAVLSIFGLATCLVLILAATAWYPTNRYEVEGPDETFDLMDWEVYEKIASDIRPPVIKQADIAEGAALLFGATHSYDPAHPQFTALEKAFDEFGPSMVFVEGRTSVLLPFFMDPIETYGESGRLIELAKQQGLPTYSWELSREEEAALLNEKFTSEQVAIYLLMRPFGGAETLDQAERQMAAIIDDRGRRPGINGVISDVQDFQTAWSKTIGSQHDWRKLSGVYGGPGFLQDMFEYGNDIRDQNLLNIIRETTARGERVMVTMGWSHTVRVEDAIDQMDLRDN
ncbi:MAG: hypothetical protein AAGC77_13125 [Pseudomonadota bacterium]